MLSQDEPAPPTKAGLSPLEATDLQDHLLVTSNDLERLQGLLSEACDLLGAHFHGANHELRGFLHGESAADPDSAAPLHRAVQHLSGAITALQFQDMAAQLVTHTTRRLRNCADRLASQTMGDDEDGPAFIEAGPDRPNPVTQDEMDAGSVELF